MEIAGLLVWINLVVIHAVVTTREIVLETQLGRIRGTVEKLMSPAALVDSHRFFYAFRRIPYSQPPIGSLRWQDPIPFGSWTSEWNATRFGSSCPQFHRGTGRIIGDEDCLFLNVYTPRLKSQGRISPRNVADDDGEQVERRQLPTQLLPVLVWFHGGGFVRGGSHEFGPHFFMEEDVLLVTVNYRLGVLGFLSTGNRHLPGNFGMLDQVMALKWIQENIADYGGDNASVTIFGESAGGAITHLLTLSPLTKGLFHKTIFHSGSGLCDWSIEKNPLEHAQDIAGKMGCPLEPAALVSCLRSQDAAQLIRIQTELLRYSLLPVRNAPVIDAGMRMHPFLPKSPADIIRTKSYPSVPMITGVTRDEGLLFYLWIHYENLFKMNNPSFLENELLPGVIAAVLKRVDQHEAVVRVIKEQYFDDVDYSDLQSFLPRLSQMLDDSMFTSCVYEAQLLHAKTSSAPIYAYVFNYKGELTPTYAAGFISLLRRAGFDHPALNQGITHADELLYLFRMNGMDAEYSSMDAKISRLMIRMWTNFARNNVPVDDYLAANGIPFWKRISPDLDSVNYFNISSNPTVTGADFRKAEHNFWLKVVPYVREMSTQMTEENNNQLAVTWALLGLFVIAVVVVAILVLTIVYRERTRKYPERGAVLQRSG